MRVFSNIEVIVWVGKIWGKSRFENGFKWI